MVSFGSDVRDTRTPDQVGTNRYKIRGIVSGIVSKIEAKSELIFFAFFFGRNNADQPLKISLELF
jgi:hypothetical protein